MQFSEVFEQIINTDDGVYINKRWKVRKDIDYIVRHWGEIVLGIDYTAYSDDRDDEVMWQMCTHGDGWQRLICPTDFFADMELLEVSPVSIEGLPELPGIVKKP